MHNFDLCIFPRQKKGATRAPNKVYRGVKPGVAEGDQLLETDAILILSKR
jgi:hypothetical protein